MSCLSLRGKCLKKGVERRQAGVRLAVFCLRLTAAHLAARGGSVASRLLMKRASRSSSSARLSCCESPSAGHIPVTQATSESVIFRRKVGSANVFVFVVGNVPIQL